LGDLVEYDDPEGRKQSHALERIREQSRLREQSREAARDFDVEVERLRGENDRRSLQLQQEYNIENRNLELQQQVHVNDEQLRFEGLQTKIKQYDDQLRYFWEVDKDVFALQARILELWAGHEIHTRQTDQAHGHSMEHKLADHSHEIAMEGEKRATKTHENELDKDNFEFKERLKIELYKELGHHSQEAVDAAFEKMKREGKI